MVTTNQQNRQAGSLLTFIVVGVVLIGLTAGGVFLAKQRGTILANESTQTTQDQPAQQEDTQQEDADDAQKQAPQDQQNGQGDNPEAGTGEGNTGAPVGPSADDEQQPDSVGTGNSGSGPTTPPAQEPEVAVAPRTGGQAAQIPATGFEDQILSSVVAFAALTYGGVRYVQSRRRLSQL